MMKPKVKIILVPYPAQGHVTPMVNLAFALANHGLEPVIVVPEFIHSWLMGGVVGSNVHSVRFVAIPDGLGYVESGHHDFFDIESSMENVMPVHLDRLLRRVDEEDDGFVACIVVDLLASYAVEVATRCGFPVAGFWPAMFATCRLVTAIPEMLCSGLITNSGCPKLQKAEVISYSSSSSSSGKAGLSTEDLPWLVGNECSIKRRFRFWCRTLHRCTSLSWLLINSFPHEYSLSSGGADDHEDGNLVCFPVGPLKKVSPAAMSSTTTNPASFWEEDGSCFEWLDRHNSDSVMYVSFGSWVKPIANHKIKELAVTLQSLNRPFLWSLPKPWRNALPDGFTDTVKTIGKLVSWAPQPRVLHHQAVGVFLTHCGWNSTVEAIQSGKRLLCYPIAGDQFANCKFVVEVWGVGVRLGGFGKGEVEAALWAVDGCEFKERVMMLRHKLAGDCEGEANLGQFVHLLYNQQMAQAEMRPSCDDALDDVVS